MKFLDEIIFILLLLFIQSSFQAFQGICANKPGYPKCTSTTKVGTFYDSSSISELQNFVLGPGDDYYCIKNNKKTLNCTTFNGDNNFCLNRNCTESECYCYGGRMLSRIVDQARRDLNPITLEYSSIPYQSKKPHVIHRVITGTTTFYLNLMDQNLTIFWTVPGDYKIQIEKDDLISTYDMVTDGLVIELPKSYFISTGVLRVYFYEVLTAELVNLQEIDVLGIKICELPTCVFCTLYFSSQWDCFDITVKIMIILLLIMMLLLAIMLLPFGMKALVWLFWTIILSPFVFFGACRSVLKGKQSIFRAITSRFTTLYNKSGSNTPDLTSTSVEETIQYDMEEEEDQRASKKRGNNKKTNISFLRLSILIVMLVSFVVAEDLNCAASSFMQSNYLRCFNLDVSNQACESRFSFVGVIPGVHRTFCATLQTRNATANTFESIGILAFRAELIAKRYNKLDCYETAAYTPIISNTFHCFGSHGCTPDFCTKGSGIKAYVNNPYIEDHYNNSHTTCASVTASWATGCFFDEPGCSVSSVLPKVVGHNYRVCALGTESFVYNVSVIFQDVFGTVTTFAFLDKDVNLVSFNQSTSSLTYGDNTTFTFAVQDFAANLAEQLIFPDHASLVSGPCFYNDSRTCHWLGPAAFPNTPLPDMVGDIQATNVSDLSGDFLWTKAIIRQVSNQGTGVKYDFAPVGLSRLLTDEFLALPSITATHSIYIKDDTLYFEQRNVNINFNVELDNITTVAPITTTMSLECRLPDGTICPLDPAYGPPPSGTFAGAYPATSISGYGGSDSLEGIKVCLPVRSITNPGFAEVTITAFSPSDINKCDGTGLLEAITQSVSIPQAPYDQVEEVCSNVRVYCWGELDFWVVWRQSAAYGGSDPSGPAIVVHAEGYFPKSYVNIGKTEGEYTVYNASNPAPSLPELHLRTPTSSSVHEVLLIIVIIIASLVGILILLAFMIPTIYLFIKYKLFHMITGKLVSIFDSFRIKITKTL